MDKIYNLQLHETYEPSKRIEVLRVPGGWIYHRFGYEDGEKQIIRSSTFVPFHNEFQK